MQNNYKVYVTMRIETREDIPAEFEYETHSLPWLDMAQGWLSIAVKCPEDKYYEIKHYETKNIHEVMIISLNTNDMQRLVINPEIITKEEIEMLEKEYEED